VKPTLSVARAMPPNAGPMARQILAPLLDRLLGIARMETLYRAHQLAGMPPVAFARAVLKILSVQTRGEEALKARLPESGATLILANHPLGGLEGVALVAALAEQRPDVKILANRALAVIPELRPLFIVTNPLKPNDPGNAESIRACHRHLAEGGLLVVFPAGRVSYYRKDRKRIADHPWHRLAGQLIRRHRPAVLPLFIGGRNSSAFYRMGRIHHRFRLLMLGREMLASEGRQLDFYPGTASREAPAMDNSQELTDLFRLLCHLQAPDARGRWPHTDKTALGPLAPPGEPLALAAELAALPKRQCLVNDGDWQVFYGYAGQIPRTLYEIRRLRESTFRHLDEGSGRPWDGDDFDATYTHLFIFHRGQQAIVGAYRMGQTDHLLSRGGSEQLYLQQAFDLGPEFVGRRAPALEMGRSFIVPEHQRSYQPLLLLFKGIGAFVAQHPQYRTLYGTVSLSTQYDALSVALIQALLVEADPQARPRQAFAHPELPDLDDFVQTWGPERAAQHLDWLVRQIEPDGKGLPVLLRQYRQLGARFHSLAIDPNFAQTPGLLLSVHLPSAPPKLLKRYMGPGFEPYLAE